ncbi:AraC family transcriptional regulator [Paenibacillus koleovorans]|uniref:AraC family transcriptional regulator n=1 Tax=Paenibacillus koleovorans TaxID=121608 RepID=UPI0013E2CD58|nr:AraC family transcriptional regulator [Paenibacillus koleovorans]
MFELVSVYLDDMTPDWHKEEAATLTDILILTVQGRAVYVIEGETVLLEKGDLLYIPKGALRSGHNAPEGPHQKYSVHFLLQPDGPFSDVVPSAYKKVGTRNFDYMKQRFMLLIQHWFRRKKHDEVVCTGIAIELLGYFVQALAEEGFASIKLRLMRKVQDYIVEHYRESIRIQELAELVDRAPNYVTQSFKEVTGMTPITYLHQVRVHSARDLILNTKLTIGEVADYLGYSDQAHFNRVFKKMMGYPPSKNK